MTTSLGSGTMELSTAMSRATAQRPQTLSTLAYPVEVAAKLFHVGGVIAQSSGPAQIFNSQQKVGDAKQNGASRFLQMRAEFNKAISFGVSGAVVGGFSGSSGGAGGITITPYLAKICA